MIRSIIYEAKFRRFFFQTAFLIALIALFAFLIVNAVTNLNAQGVATGFGFLSETAGFSIIQTLIHYEESSSYLRAFAVGLLNTLLVSSLGIVLATIAGFLIGISRLSKNFLVSRISNFYIETIRNIPLLLQIFFWYFVVLRAAPHPRKSYSFFDSVFVNNRGIYLPTVDFNFNVNTGLFLLPLLVFLVWLFRSLMNKNLSMSDKRPWLYATFAVLVSSALWSALEIPFKVNTPVLQGFNFVGGVTLIPEFLALLAALVIYTAAFIAEIVRAGIEAVPKGQVEAAKALGLKKNVILKKIVIPQALRVIIPPLTSQFLNLTKNSSLAAAIGYPEIVSIFAGTVLNQTGQAVEVVFITMSVYMVISLIISIAMNIYNEKSAITER